ncbi:MAG: hypothetical protein ACFFEF_14090 [Candidatus Thorarchaeota archaeon]
MSKETRKSVNQIIETAIDFFTGIYGFSISDSVPNCCIEFRNDLGYVTVQVFPKGKLNEVVLTTQEWDYQIMQFAEAI